MGSVSLLEDVTDRRTEEASYVHRFRSKPDPLAAHAVGWGAKTPKMRRDIELLFKAFSRAVDEQVNALSTDPGKSGKALIDQAIALSRLEQRKLTALASLIRALPDGQLRSILKRGHISMCAARAHWN